MSCSIPSNRVPLRVHREDIDALPPIYKELALSLIRDGDPRLLIVDDGGQPQEKMTSTSRVKTPQYRTCEKDANIIGTLRNVVGIGGT